MKRKLRFFLLLLTAISLLCGALQLGVYHLNDRFSISHIFAEPAAGQLLLKEQITDRETQILDQPFFYLGQGSQCFVFQSEDQRCVLKFIKHQRLRLPRYLIPFFKEKAVKKEQKREKLFQSIQIASEELKEESGLLFAHLNKRSDFNKQVTIVDKLKRRYSIDLGSCDFILQYRGELLYPYLLPLSGEKAENSLCQLLQLLKSRCIKGIHDNDAVLSKNVGFEHGRPVFLDIGEFSYDEKIKERENYQKEIHKITRKLEAWISERDPQLALYLEQELLKL